MCAVRRPLCQQHTFVEQLRQARDATHSKNHPYFRKWAQGELTKKQMGFYLVMHYHFVTEYLNWLAHMWAHCPVERSSATSWRIFRRKKIPEIAIWI